MPEDPAELFPRGLRPLPAKDAAGFIGRRRGHRNPLSPFPAADGGGAR